MCAFNLVQLSKIFNVATAVRNAQHIKDDTDLVALYNWLLLVNYMEEHEQAQVIAQVGTQLDGLLDCWAGCYLADGDLNLILDILEQNIGRDE